MSTELEQADDGALLDLLFVQDATKSMDPYIKSAKNNIIEICQVLTASGRLKRHNGLQVGLLAYRDYPAELNEFVTNQMPFTYNLQAMEDYLSTLKAFGGGDAPEAFSTALEHAYTKTTGWREEALKAVVFVTDAAPHGINEKCDDLPDGAPPGVFLSDPIQLTKEMASKGYRIYILACEPTLSGGTRYAKDFYQALADSSLGVYCTLTNHNVLAAYVIGSLLEGLDLRKLSSEYQSYIAKLVNEGWSIDEIVNELHKSMTSQGRTATTVQSADIYNNPTTANHNYELFMKSKTLAIAKGSLKEVYGPRINPGCMSDIRDYNGATEADEDGNFLKVSIRFKNSGSRYMALKMFDAQLRNMSNNVVVPNKFVMTRKFRINVPFNFSLECGRETKNFSRTFDKEGDLDLEQIFENSD